MRGGIIAELFAPNLIGGSFAADADAVAGVSFGFAMRLAGAANSGVAGVAADEGRRRPGVLKSAIPGVIVVLLEGTITKNPSGVFVRSFTILLTSFEWARNPSSVLFKLSPSLICVLDLFRFLFFAPKKSMTCFFCFSFLFKK